MSNIRKKLSRRQFMKSTALTIVGFLSFIILGVSERGGAQSEKTSPGMSKYICEICGYIYDPANGDPSQIIPAGIPFEKLPNTWKCPICGADKTMFKKL
jgi:rubredoxin